MSNKTRKGEEQGPTLFGVYNFVKISIMKVNYSKVSAFLIIFLIWNIASPFFVKYPDFSIVPFILWIIWLFVSLLIALLYLLNLRKNEKEVQSKTTDLITSFLLALASFFIMKFLFSITTDIPGGSFFPPELKVQGFLTFSASLILIPAYFFIFRHSTTSSLGKKLLWILLIFAIAYFSIFVLYLGWARKNSTSFFFDTEVDKLFRESIEKGGDRTSSPTPISFVADNLKTYKNIKYGYEISYPAEWELAESSDLSAVQLRNSGLEFSMSVRDNPQKKPVKDFLVEENYLSGYRIIQENIQVSGQEAVKAKFVWEWYVNETILFFNSPDGRTFFNVLGVEESILNGVMANFKFY